MQKNEHSDFAVLKACCFACSNLVKNKIPYTKLKLFAILADSGTISFPSEPFNPQSASPFM